MLKMKDLIGAYLIMIVIFISSHAMALDLTHWDENKVRSSNTTIWKLLSVKCGKVSNPAKKPNCDKQIQKWKNQREMNKQENKKKKYGPPEIFNIKQYNSKYGKILTKQKILDKLESDKGLKVSVKIFNKIINGEY